MRDIIVGHANTWHDPAIAISEGKGFFAEGIERHTQCKKSMDMPRLWYSWREIQNYLKQQGEWPVKNANVLSLGSWSDVPEGQLTSRLNRNPLVALLLGSRLLEPIFVNQLRWIFRDHPPRPFVPPLPSVLSSAVHQVENVKFTTKNVLHQLAHAANAVYTSPFEDCIVMVIDGYSEGTAISFYHFEDNNFNLLYHEQPQISLGLLYGQVTQLCGFDPYQGEEWKVMGLAAYGSYRESLHKFFSSRLKVQGLSINFQPVGNAVYAFDRSAWAELEELVGGFRKPGEENLLRVADLAYNFQKSFEETLIALARGASGLGLSKNLAISGGCALNSAANGKLLAETDFRKLHVPSAPGDDGNALGVVLYEKYQIRAEPRPLEVMSPYLGSKINLEEVERIVELGCLRCRKIEDESDLVEEVALELSSGKIVAWVQGRAEFGPRALGNRSILADPRSPSMKTTINSRVKFREFYRPLAPAILDEFGPEYFVDYQQSPYMERTFLFRPEVRNKVPAVVHEDGTGRAQSVTKELNPLFHQLLSRFHVEAGVPVLLNTSFNVMGKPIVHSAQDAVTVFYTSGLDLLVIGPFILDKPSS